MTKDDLIAFEKEVAAKYEAGLIRAPVHLSSGNESQLIEIFKDIKRADYVCATWRNHLHALLHGIEPDEVMRQILAGKSMSLNSVEPWFYTSSIAGGVLPIAVGLGLAIKRVKCGKGNCCHCSCKDLNCTTMYMRTEDGGHLHYDDLPCPMWNRRVFVFIGDMVSLTGGFHEATRYAWNFKLPVTFVVEDNRKSVQTDTMASWGIKPSRWTILHTGPEILGELRAPEEFLPNIEYYQYELKYPHHGTGKYIAF